MPRYTLAALSFLTLAFVGCAQNNADMAAMKPPQRPAELDQLAPLVGTWEGHWECTACDGKGESMKGSGTNTVSWDADGWVLVEHMTGEMGEMGKMSGIGVWTWDAKAHCFRNWWADNWGSTGHGTTRYDAATHTWKTKAYGINPMTGAKTRAESEMKLVGDNKLEFTYTEWDGLGLTKFMEMKGTSTRK